MGLNTAKHDYEILAAAHLIRSPDMAARFGPMVLQTEGGFFDLFNRDVVVHALRHYEQTGRLLPAAALKLDCSRFRRDGTTLDNYLATIDKIYAVDREDLSMSKGHVEATLVETTQASLLWKADPTKLCQQGDLEGLWALTDEIRHLGALGNGAAKRPSEGLLSALRHMPKGIPTGFPELDAGLAAKGIASGETLLLFGRYSIGKSMLMHHVVRYAAKAGRLCLLWSHETGETQTRLRIIKGFTGLSDAQLRGDPDRAFQVYRETLDANGIVEPFVKFTPGRTTPRQIEAEIDRIEQDVGRKVELLAVDHSEKRIDGKIDWTSIKAAYEEIREVCGKREMAGLDAGQENKGGQISYFNLLKDADISVQLTIKSPREWARMTSGWKQSDKIEMADLEIPSAGPVWGKVVRCREGKSGTEFTVWVDRTTGQVSEWKVGQEVEE